MYVCAYMWGGSVYICVFLVQVCLTTTKFVNINRIKIICHSKYDGIHSLSQPFLLELDELYLSVEKSSGAVLHDCNTSTKEKEAERIHKFMTKPTCIIRPYLKN